MSETPIPLRELGKTGVKVPAIGLGCMGMSPGTYGNPDPEECQRVLDRAVELGCTFWDTADAYGLGHNETFLSKSVQKNRDKVILCTKFALRIREPGVLKSAYICCEPDYVKEACAKSLERLNIEKIDLYYMHRLDKNTPIEDTVKAMAELVKEGKVKYIGLSEVSAKTLRRAYAIHPITALQVEYSPWTTDIERNGILTTCEELGITVVAYSPLGRGMLTGTFQKPEDIPDDDWRKTNPRFQKENFYKNLELVHQFTELAKAKGCTPGQLALAWVLAQSKNIVVIPGTKKMKYLEENVGAKDVILTPEELKKIRAVIESIEVAGARYESSPLLSLDH